MKAKGKITAKLRAAAALTGLSLLLIAARATAAGGPGYALQFQTSGNVAIPHHDAFNTLPLTVTAWCQTPGILIGGIVTKSAVFGMSGWQVSVSSGELGASYQAPNGFVGMTFDPLRSPGFGDNRWHHFAFVVDATGGRLYVDGVLRDSRAWNGEAGAVTGSEQVMLGSFDGGGAAYNGLLDEVTIWNVALNESQVRSNMNRSLSGLEPGLIAYYRCDDVTGPIQDSAPLAGTNSGTLLSGSVVPSSIAPFSPGVTTLAATLSNSTATLNGTAHPAGTNTWAWFEWGTTTNYGSFTPPQSVGAGTNQVSFNHSLTGLPAGLTHHFRAIASNTFGFQADADREFELPAFHHVVIPLPRGAGTAAWGDYDGDGRLDLVWHGFVSQNGMVSSLAEVLRNTGSGFSNINAGLSPMSSAIATWADADNDGRLDILRTGAQSGGGFPTEIWRNTGSTFSNIIALQTSEPGMPPCVGDVDVDGRLDVLFSWANMLELSGSCPRVQVFHIEPGGSVERSAAFIRNTVAHAFALADFDNDGWGDLIWSGYKIDDECSDVGSAITELHRNVSGTFSDPVLSLPALGLGLTSIAWGDYDNDGLLDLLFIGAPGTNQTQIWRNTGNSFTNINAAIGNFSGGSGEWGDYDNDGRLDLLLTGGTSGGSACQVWRNTGSGFNRLPMTFPSGPTFAAWGDYDDDGRLDIVLTGMTNGASGAYLQIWRNVTAVANTPPAAPTGLTVAAAGSDIVFSWNASNDAETPAPGLTYNLRVGTTPGGNDVVVPMSSSNGQRHLPAMGNAQKTLFRRISGLPLNRPLYWSVQAVDTGFRGGPFAAEKALTLSVVPAVVGSNVTGDTNGDGRVDRAEAETVLAHYWPSSPWLLMTNTAGPDAQVMFTSDAAFSAALHVQASAALTNWQTIGSAIPFFLLTDTNAAAGAQRHYRLRLP